MGGTMHCPLLLSKTNMLLFHLKLSDIPHKKDYYFFFNINRKQEVEGSYFHLLCKLSFISIFSLKIKTLQPYCCEEPERKSCNSLTHANTVFPNFLTVFHMKTNGVWTTRKSWNL